MRPRHPPSKFALTLVVLLAAGVWLWPEAALAHGDLHERIQQLSGQIAAQPADASLLLQRADLFRQHGEFTNALADLEAAEKLSADRRAVLLAQTRVFSDAGQTTNAVRAASELLTLEPTCVEALTLRARNRFKLGQVVEAVEDFNAAISNSARAEPDLYLERASAQAALGRFAAAIKGLDDGMARIGMVDSLQLAAIGYERQCGEFATALTRLDKLTAGQPVKEPWQVLRGEILNQAGRYEEAKRTFQEAITGIANYPTARRELEMTRQLQTRARDGLARAEIKLDQPRLQAATPGARP